MEIWHVDAGFSHREHAAGGTSLTKKTMVSDTKTYGFFHVDAGFSHWEHAAGGASLTKKQWLGFVGSVMLGAETSAMAESGRGVGSCAS